MNTTDIYQSAINKGLKDHIPISEQTEPLNKAPEQRVQHIHNDWLKHQNTHEILHKLKKQRDGLVSLAVQKNKLADSDRSITRVLAMIEQIDLTLEIIYSYGDNRDTNNS